MPSTAGTVPNETKSSSKHEEVTCSDSRVQETLGQTRLVLIVTRYVMSGRLLNTHKRSVPGFIAQLLRHFLIALFVAGWMH